MAIKCCKYFFGFMGFGGQLSCLSVISVDLVSLTYNVKLGV